MKNPVDRRNSQSLKGQSTVPGQNVRRDLKSSRPERSDRLKKFPSKRSVAIKKFPARTLRHHEKVAGIRIPTKGSSLSRFSPSPFQIPRLPSPRWSAPEQNKYSNNSGISIRPCLLRAAFIGLLFHPSTEVFGRNCESDDRTIYTLSGQVNRRWVEASPTPPLPTPNSLTFLFGSHWTISASGLFVWEMSEFPPIIISFISNLSLLRQLPWNSLIMNDIKSSFMIGIWTKKGGSLFCECWLLAVGCEVNVVQHCLNRLKVLFRSNPWFCDVNMLPVQLMT
jgi:hypothetical protein